MRCDCVIVGGGPAGSVTALLLARAGFDVMLLDRAHFPRAKACGDCISPQANLLLDQLSLLPKIQAARPARLEAWRIFAPSGASFEASFAGVTADPRLQHGISINRENLDAVLLDAARAAGARIVTGIRVEDVLRPNGHVGGVRARFPDGAYLDVEARLTVGADGLRSIIRRRLGLASRPPRLRKVALTAHLLGVKGVDAVGELHIGARACVGLAPVDERRNVCNVTLVVDADRHGRSLAGKSTHAFASWLERFPALAGRFESAAPGWPLLASGPFDWPARGIVTNGAVLVGDAAGYYDPFTGQGIFQAIAGAGLLARAAEQAFQRGRASAPLHAYASACTRMVQRARRVQRGIESVCAHALFAETCVRALANSPAAASALIGVTGDLRLPRSLLSPTVLFSFLRGMTRSGW